MTLGCWQFPFKGHSVFFRQLHGGVVGVALLLMIFLLFFDDHGHILCAAVADFDGISIKHFVELARSREVLVN